MKIWRFLLKVCIGLCLDQNYMLRILSVLFWNADVSKNSSMALQEQKIIKENYSGEILLP